MPTSNEQNNNFFAFSLIDILGLIIGLENMQLNISANDLDKQTDAILGDLHSYLSNLDKHLALQDEHLKYQDLRIVRLEQALNGNKNGNGVMNNDEL